MTGSMRRALEEMARRRDKQIEHNQKHKITPRTIQKAVLELEEFQYDAKKRGLSLLRDAATSKLTPKNAPQILRELENQMREAADRLDFELAAMLRDQMLEIREMSPTRNS